MSVATSAIVRIRKIAKLSLQWCLSMSWHLYRIATFRPAFSFIADKKLSVVSFGAVFWLASVIRFAVVGQGGVHYATINCMLYFFWLCVLLERRERSSSLLCTALGLSAVIDMSAVALHLAHLWPSAVSTYKASTVAFVGELAAISVLRWRFFKAPAVVQLVGYGRDAK